MYYTSTRNKDLRVTASEAITKGISDEGGLFVPCEIPKLTRDDIDALIPLSYKERAKKILSLYLTDFTEEEIDYCVDQLEALVPFFNRFSRRLYININTCI